MKVHVLIKLEFCENVYKAAGLYGLFRTSTGSLIIMLLNINFREHYKESLARLIYKHDIIPVLPKALPTPLPDAAEQMPSTALTSRHVGHI